MKKWNVKREYLHNIFITDVLLENRGFTTSEEKEIFLNPPDVNYWLRILPIETLTGVKNARDIVQQAIKDNMPIIIHGDYDADGICATTVLYDTIKNRLGYDNILAFIPNRFEHGYGLSKKSLGFLLTKFPNSQFLLITVDSGITSFSEVAELKNLGHKVIITDHHQKPMQIPDADCIVWHDEIVGTTLAWLLSNALFKDTNDLLAFCALATVTDLQPITNFNRTIVKRGLEILNDNPPLGLKKLFEVSGKFKDKITTYELGWVIGPRLNASGRLTDASIALELLLSKDEKKAEEFATTLNSVNMDRQDKTLEMYEMATDFTDKDVPKIIFSQSEAYHEGIIGLVAAKLMQKHYRPAIVMSVTDGIAKGSVRSIPGVNIIEILRNFDDMFLSLGGHPMAAGFSILIENVPKMQSNVENYINTLVGEELLIPTLEIDLKIPVNLVSQDLYNTISKLRPYGLGNSEPIFASFGLGVTSTTVVGRDSAHLSLRLFDGQDFYKAIFFGGAEKVPNLKVGDTINIAYMLSENTFNGKTTIDLVIKDMQIL